MTIWYIDPRIRASDESDLFDGGYGTGRLRDSWEDVTWASLDDYYQACKSTYVGDVTAGASGTFSKKITIGAYGNGAKPIMQGLNDGLSLSSRTNIRVSGLDIRAGLSSKVGVIQLSASATTYSGIDIEDCDVTGGKIGIRIRGAGNRVRRNIVTRAEQDAMYMEIADTDIIENVLVWFDQDSSQVGDGIQFAGTHDHGYVNVINNYIDGATSSSSVKQCIITAAGTASSFIVEGNKLFGMNQSLNIAIAGAKVQGNYLVDPVGSGWGVALGGNDIYVVGNYFSGCQRVINVGATTGGRFYNNTCLNCGDGIVLNTASSSLDSKNNILLASSSLSGNLVLKVSTATLTSDFNAYSPSGTYSWNSTVHSSLSAYQSASSQEENSLSTNTSFDEIHCPVQANLLNAGTTLGGRDLHGKEFTAPPNIGAVQHWPSKAIGSRSTGSRSIASRKTTYRRSISG